MNFSRFYIDRRGRSYSVDKARGGRGPGWCSYCYAGNHNIRRLCKRRLPDRLDEATACLDLAAYAKRKRWTPIGTKEIN